MGIEITMSSKGQIVIPKQMRDALALRPGERLTLDRIGRRMILEAPAPSPRKISYDEFRRRMPTYDGPPVVIEDMTVDFDRLWGDGDGRGA